MSKFKVWVEDGYLGSVQDSDDFNANSQRTQGFQPGQIVPSKTFNTVLRQNSLVVTALMNAINVPDTIDLTSSLEDVTALLKDAFINTLPDDVVRYGEDGDKFKLEIKNLTKFRIESDNYARIYGQRTFIGGTNRAVIGYAGLTEYLESEDENAEYIRAEFRQDGFKFRANNTYSSVGAYEGGRKIIEYADNGPSFGIHCPEPYSSTGIDTDEPVIGYSSGGGNVYLGQYQGASSTICFRLSLDKDDSEKKFSFTDTNTDNIAQIYNTHEIKIHPYGSSNTWFHYYDWIGQGESSNLSNRFKLQVDSFRFEGPLEVFNENADEDAYRGTIVAGFWSADAPPIEDGIISELKENALAFAHWRHILFDAVDSIRILPETSLIEIGARKIELNCYDKESTYIIKNADNIKMASKGKIKIGYSSVGDVDKYGTREPIDGTKLALLEFEEDKITFRNRFREQVLQLDNYGSGNNHSLNRIRMFVGTNGTDRHTCFSAVPDRVQIGWVEPQGNRLVIANNAITIRDDSDVERVDIQPNGSTTLRGQYGYTAVHIGSDHSEGNAIVLGPTHTSVLGGDIINLIPSFSANPETDGVSPADHDRIKIGGSEIIKPDTSDNEPVILSYKPADSGDMMVPFAITREGEVYYQGYEIVNKEQIAITNDYIVLKDGNDYNDRVEFNFANNYFVMMDEDGGDIVKFHKETDSFGHETTYMYLGGSNVVAYDDHNSILKFSTIDVRIDTKLYIGEDYNIYDKRDDADQAELYLNKNGQDVFKISDTDLSTNIQWGSYFSFNYNKDTEALTIDAPTVKFTGEVQDNSNSMHSLKRLIRTDEWVLRNGKYVIDLDIEDEHILIHTLTAAMSDADNPVSILQFIYTGSNVYTHDYMNNAFYPLMQGTELDVNGYIITFDGFSIGSDECYLTLATDSIPVNDVYIEVTYQLNNHTVYEG